MGKHIPRVAPLCKYSYTFFNCLLAWMLTGQENGEFAWMLTGQENGELGEDKDEQVQHQRKEVPKEPCREEKEGRKKAPKASNRPSMTFILVAS